MGNLPQYVPFPLNSDYEHTLGYHTGWVEGLTLRNYRARVMFKPRLPGEGRHITVTVKGEVVTTFKVGLSSGRVGHNWTDAVHPETLQGVGVVEHPAAAIVLAGLDNVEMVVDYPDKRAASLFYAGGKCSSVPLMDGTAYPYLNAIRKVGVVGQHPPRKWLTLSKEIYFEVGESRFRLSPRPQKGWSLFTMLPESTMWWRRQQYRAGGYDTAEADDGNQMLLRMERARPTNVHWKDWLVFKALTFGTGRKADFAAIHRPWGTRPLDGQRRYRPVEALPHKLLDITADIQFFLGYLQADISVTNGSHASCHAFRQHLLRHSHTLILPTPT